MDIKDSYLHGTVGVVKSINVDGDKIKYTLADVANTTKTVALPLATTTNNGLLSNSDKIKLNTLRSAAYTNSSDYAVKQTLSNEDLNTITTPGFYNAAGGNTCTNKPREADYFGMYVIHCAGGLYYVLILFPNSSANHLYRRHCINGEWSSWTLDKLTDTTYSVVSNSANGLAPKVINTNTATVGSTYYVLASTNGSATPSWYKLPANSFSNDDTKVTQTNTNSWAEYRVLLSGNANDTSETTTSYKSNKLTFNPNTGTLSPISIKAAYSETSIDSILKPSTIAWYHVSMTGVGTLPRTGNDNGILWLGHHGPESGSAGVGYGYLLGFTNLGIYARKVYNSVFQENWNQIAYTTSDITGNAASANKLKIARKLWGLDFDGTADVSGALSGVTNIVSNKDYNLELITPEGDKFIYLRVNNDDTTSISFNGLSFLPTTNSNDKIYLGTDSNKWKAVCATNLYGNLDGIYVNKLTGYSKATSASNIAATDTLNIALGKLEYKADWACDWITSVTTDDTDALVNKWGEIVDFLDSVTEGTDITDEFVTRKTALTITGAKYFVSSIGTQFEYNKYGVRLIGSGDCGYLQLGQTDGEGTRIHKGKITGISADWLNSLDIWSHQSIFSGSVTATKLITKDGTSSQFVKGDGSLDSNTYATTTSLDNYVTLNTVQTITASKTFNKIVTFSATPGVYIIRNSGVPFLRFGKDANTVYGAIGADENGNVCIYNDVKGLGWDTVLSSRNYTSYTVKKDGTGATGIWGIDISGSATKLDGNSETSYLRRRGDISKAYVNLTTYTSGDPNYHNYATGIYNVIYTNDLGAMLYSDTLVHFEAGGSTSALELLTTLTHDSRIKVRKTIDSNRVSGAWKELAWYSDIPTKLSQLTNDIGTNSQFKTTVLPGKAGWYRIATSPIHEGNCLGDFEVKGYTSGYHTITKFITNISYATSTGITVLNTSHFNNNQGTISKVRILYASNYNNGYAYLEVCSLGYGCNLDISQISGQGWTLIDEVTETTSIPSGYTTKEVSLTNNTFTTTGASSFAGDSSFAGQVTIKGYCLSITNTSGNQYILMGNQNGGGTNKPSIIRASNGATYIGYGDDWSSSTGGTYNPICTFAPDGSVTATKFIGNVTGNVSGSSGSCTGNAATATTLKPTAVISNKTFSLINTTWTDTGYTFANLATGTYVVQVTSGTNLVASGIMSVYKNLSDSIGDEIPLHVYGTAGWRPYLRTYQNKLLISSNDASATSRTVTIKIAQIL